MSVTSLDRRKFLSACAAVGAGGLFPGALLALASRASAEGAPVIEGITSETIAEAARIAGIEIPEAARAALLEGLASQVRDFDAIRALRIPNDVPPAFLLDVPAPRGARAEPAAASRPSEIAAPSMPEDLRDLCFADVRTLSELVRTRKVSSVTLTELSLARLKKLDPLLSCVVTLTEERALESARRADAEIAAGRWRGPLHGIPWGAKDLLAVAGYPTTWGARGFEKQSFDEDAEVVRRLDEAGAVLVAKLSLGALAMGDLWFGGRTRNPWKLEQGSSGSSAGSASAVAAGCVPFAIGSETLGSISSPATRCGVTGLRPTFGRVPRTGAMALSWTMDKIGPIARSVEDCALVLEAIAGADAADPSSRGARPFRWDAMRSLDGIRVGYLKGLGKGDDPAAVAAEREAERVLRARGLSAKQVELPDMPWGAMVPILLAEAAAAFDDLTRSGKDALLDGQAPDDWPNLFRMSRFIPAVEYIQASRARRLGMDAMARLFEEVDVVLAPTDDVQLVASNLTGNPAVILPAGFRAADAPEPKGVTDHGGPGTPVSITFLGAIGGEAELCAVAHSYQLATSSHRMRPPLPR